MGIAQRVVTVAGAFFAGVLSSVSVVALHSSWWWLGFAAVGTVAAMLAPTPAGWARLPFALGWMLVVFGALLGRPEGDNALGADPKGYAVLIGGLIVLAIAAATSMTHGVEPSQNAPLP